VDVQTPIPAGPLAKVEYREVARSPHLSVGAYLLPRGAADPQRPHAEDEAYFVARGRAKFEVEGRVSAVSAGSLVWVPARAPHRFFDIEEDLALFVAFGPAEGTRR
jgi:mannose-6-phosphate isomerase-like protein (cupin superfamily)